ncbi:hypothetical protein NQ317_005154 [Molorchus minor]|uniref:Uncharacterized protein n=1 Tax=Molorchus minor TaxID=1323400 RepID=A0ABQ9K1P6_9CUCU|nr:hypothetical protein NQ317_005154 [Molorchus minor]
MESVNCPMIKKYELNIHLFNRKKDKVSVWVVREVMAGEEEPGDSNTWLASSPNSQEVDDVVDVDRLWLGVFDECRVKDFVQAWRPRVLPLLVVLDSLLFRGMVELLYLEVDRPYIGWQRNESRILSFVLVLNEYELCPVLEGKVVMQKKDNLPAWLEFRARLSHPTPNPLHYSTGRICQKLLPQKKPPAKDETIYLIVPLVVIILIMLLAILVYLMAKRRRLIRLRHTILQMYEFDSNEQEWEPLASSEFP